MEAPELYYTIATDRLTTQMQQIDQLDTKAATVYTVASVIIAFFAGLLTLTMLPANLGIRVIEVILMGLTFVFYVALSICLLKSYQVGDWSLRPSLTDLQTNCIEYAEGIMKEWVADECLRSYQENKPKIVQKAIWFNRALIALTCESGLIALAGAIAAMAK